MSLEWGKQTRSTGLHFPFNVFCYLSLWFWVLQFWSETEAGSFGTESTLPEALCLVDALIIKNFLRDEQPSCRYRTAKTVTTVGNKARATSNYLKKTAGHGHTIGIQTGRSLYDSLLAWSTSNFQTGTENCWALADLKMLVTLGFLLNTFKWDLH